MPRVLVVILLLLVGGVATAAPLSEAAVEGSSKDTVVGWIYRYRETPEPQRLPKALKTLSQSGAFKDPESAGVFVGFIAGVLGSNPANAEELIVQALPLPAADQWVMVRAIAYSGLPNWKEVLTRAAPHLADRKVMIEKYLAGKLRTLDGTALDADASMLDTLWGVYFATGKYPPIARLVAVLPWSKDGDSEEKLTVGNMAKYTLAANATRDMRLLAMLRSTIPVQPKKVKPILTEVVEAAETATAPKIRKEALAAIEERKRKGPESQRKISAWGQVGEGAIAIGCIVAAVTGQVQFGVPCVVGGAVTSAVLRWWSNR
jgi:hypothetical protein